MSKGKINVHHNGSSYKCDYGKHEEAVIKEQSLEMANPYNDTSKRRYQCHSEDDTGGNLLWRLSVTLRNEHEMTTYIKRILIDLRAGHVNCILDSPKA